MSNLFRKKPVVVEAVQYPCEHPALKRCNCAGSAGCSFCGDDFIETLEGRMRVSSGDWIITGVHGEHYPCKPDIFAATYEPADSAPVVDEAMVERAMDGYRHGDVQWMMGNGQRLPGRHSHAMRAALVAALTQSKGEE